MWWFGCSSKGRRKRSGAGATLHAGVGQVLTGVGLVSGPRRSDVPPKLDPDQGEERGFSFWNILARPFRGIFISD